MIVVDTHIFLWDAIDPSRLSRTAKKHIKRADERGALILSEISNWEISMLIKKGRIRVDETPAKLIRTILDSRNYYLRCISPEIAELSVELPDELGFDPADRLIAATAIIEGFPLLTADKVLRKAKSIETVW